MCVCACVCVCVCVCAFTIAGPGECVGEDEVRLDEWTTVVAERDRNDGSLIVNDAPAVKGTHLYTYTPVYTYVYTPVHTYIHCTTSYLQLSYTSPSPVSPTMDFTRFRTAVHFGGLNLIVGDLFTKQRNWQQPS